MDSQQPGQVIAPHNADEPQQPGVGAPPEPDRPLEEPNDTPQPAPAPTPEPDPTTLSAASPQPDPAALAPAAAPASDAAWEFHPSVNPFLSPDTSPLPEELTWTASEFIAHEKNTLWYALLVAGGLAVAASDYLLFKDAVSSVVILLAVVAFAVLSGRKPRTQQYAITPAGVQIGTKSYFFHDFKNFSVAEEGATASIVFMPMKRFMPSLTIYVAPDMEDQVIDFIGAILPFEQHRADAFDALMRRIRF